MHQLLIKASGARQHKVRIAPVVLRLRDLYEIALVVIEWR